MCVCSWAVVHMFVYACASVLVLLIVPSVFLSAHVGFPALPFSLCVFLFFPVVTGGLAPRVQLDSVLPVLGSLLPELTEQYEWYGYCTVFWM
jgi:hypothetical protein